MTTDHLFQAHLDTMFDLLHPLTVQGRRMPWVSVEAWLAPPFEHTAGRGRLHAPTGLGAAHAIRSDRPATPTAVQARSRRAANRPGLRHGLPSLLRQPISRRRLGRTPLTRFTPDCISAEDGGLYLKTDLSLDMVFDGNPAAWVPAQSTMKESRK